ncbi:ATP-binding protein [Anaerovibrio sp. RM50]|uniref:ATP-binding protein n=1 Tax=Anaerovibrio sp. RM50 TaxID=1200557 RepID=UPI0006841617|nr:ATP-binding protein [Anaerovibrio sp. RM50]
MFYYAVIGLIATAVLLIVNYDILFIRDERQNLPAMGTYKKFLYGIIAYYITDIMWGYFDAQHLTNFLYWDTVIYFIVMALNVMLWTKFVVSYLEENNLFGRALTYTGQCFFPLVVILVLLNFFTPMLFWIDKSGTYQAGPLRHLQLFLQIVLLLLTSAYAFKTSLTAEDFGKKRYRPIYLFGIVVAIMLMVQMKYPLLPVYTIGFMLGTCLLHSFVFQNELEKYRQGMLESMEKADLHEKLSQAKSNFLSNVSHEIRTPINTFLGMNELILRESTEKDIISYAGNAKKAGNMLLGLVDEIFDFTKIETGNIEITPVEYDLSVMLNELVNMVQKQAHDKGLEISLYFDRHIPKFLFGDDVRIKQVILNILTNAVKFTKEGSIIFTVAFKPIDDEHILLSVSVKDTGIGIKPEDKDKLFDKFERVDRKHNRNVEGAGLGLPISQKLLKMMGSALYVESIYGVGSTFFFRLEQKVMGQEQLGDFQATYDLLLKEHKRYHEKFTAPTARVLAVDDNQMSLKIFKGLLKNTKIQIDLADTGNDGLMMAKNLKYDIIFLDHMMDEMDGIETLHELRENRNGPNASTPVICVTANAISGAREKYLETGFNDYITKPVDWNKLENMLITYLPEEKIYISTETDAEEIT